MLQAWLRCPHVVEWWGPADPIASLRDDYVTHVDAPDATRAYIAHLDERPVGFIQAYVAAASGDGWWTEVTDRGVHGIDQFLAEASDLGQGLGTAMVQAFVAALFARPEVTLVQTDPRPDNLRAIRCYEKAGFARVGVIDTPDGAALLMHCTRAAAAALAAR